MMEEYNLHIPKKEWKEEWMNFHAKDCYVASFWGIYIMATHVVRNGDWTKVSGCYAMTHLVLTPTIESWVYLEWIWEHTPKIVALIMDTLRTWDP